MKLVFRAMIDRIRPIDWYRRYVHAVGRGIDWLQESGVRLFTALGIGFAMFTFLYARPALEAWRADEPDRIILAPTKNGPNLTTVRERVAWSIFPAGLSVLFFSIGFREWRDERKKAFRLRKR